MPIVKLTLTEDQFARLTAMAGKKSVQQHLRELAFGDGENPFTPQEAVQRIMEKIRNDSLSAEEFTLPDAYEKEEWNAVGTRAGRFGLEFGAYVAEHPDTGIRFKHKNKDTGRTVYEYVKKEA